MIFWFLYYRIRDYYFEVVAIFIISTLLNNLTIEQFLMQPSSGCTMFCIMTSILPNGGAIYDAPNIRKGAIYDAPKNREGAIFDAYKVEKISIFGREFISFLFMYTFYFY